MEDLKRIVIFIGFVFVLLFGLTMLGISNESVLAPYEPIQTVRPTTHNDRVEVYDSLIDFNVMRRVTKPYVLVTESEKAEFMEEPTFRMIDYGTYREIDSLKCIRYKQMQWKLYYLDKLKEKSCN